MLVTKRPPQAWPCVTCRISTNRQMNLLKKNEEVTDPRHICGINSCHNHNTDPRRTTVLVKFSASPYTEIYALFDVGSKCRLATILESMPFIERYFGSALFGCDLTCKVAEDIWRMLTELLQAAPSHLGGR